MVIFGCARHNICGSGKENSPKPISAHDFFWCLISVEDKAFSIGLPSLLIDISGPSGPSCSVWLKIKWLHICRFAALLHVRLRRLDRSSSAALASRLPPGDVAIMIVFQT